MQFALCNEVLRPLTFSQQCEVAAQLGYDALEVAPFTLADDPRTISEAQARGCRRIAEDAGVAISGLHWLLVAPSGLSITSADAALHERTIDAMERLVELCAAMGGRYLVHGSPQQRALPAGEPRARPARGRSSASRAPRGAPRLAASPIASSRWRRARRTSSTPSPRLWRWSTRSARPRCAR
jgi:sugar phosphate isomerase/epimerase